MPQATFYFHLNCLDSGENPEEDVYHCRDGCVESQSWTEQSCVHTSDFCLPFYVGDKIGRAFKRATFDLDMLISF